MKILIQWTKQNPDDWEEYDSSEWDSLQGKPYQVNMQGVCFTADHYAVEDFPNGVCKVTYWNDDDEDYPEGEKYACEWFFHPIKNGKTKQLVIRYDQSEIRKRVAKNIQNVTYKDFSEFVKPSEQKTKHGVWVSSELNNEHDRKRSVRGWREWIG